MGCYLSRMVRATSIDKPAMIPRLTTYRGQTHHQKVLLKANLSKVSHARKTHTNAKKQNGISVPCSIVHMFNLYCVCM